MMSAIGARPATEAAALPASWGHRFEAWGAALFFAVFGFLPLDMASALGVAGSRRAASITSTAPSPPAGGS